MEPRFTRSREKARLVRLAAISSGKRKLDYREPDNDQEPVPDVLQIKPRPRALKVKRARGDSRRSQPVRDVAEDEVAGCMGLMSELLDSNRSADGLDQQTHRRFRPANGFGGTCLPGINYYRCNIQTALYELDYIDFSKEQYDLLALTPFWFLFKALKESDIESLSSMCSKNDEGVRLILEHYDTNRKCMVLAGQDVPFNRLDVELILGVCAGVEHIPVKSVPGAPKTKWLRRCFKTDLSNPGKPLQLRRSTLLTKLTERLTQSDADRDEDVVRLVVAYLLACVLAPNQNNAIPIHVADCIEDLGSICRYDWATYILEVLIDQFRTASHLRSGGCVLFVAYWLCEHSHLLMPDFPDAFPRCLRWDLLKLWQEVMEHPLWEIRRNMVVTEKLVGRDHEVALGQALVKAIQVAKAKATKRAMQANQSVNSRALCLRSGRKVLLEGTGEAKSPVDAAEVTSFCTTVTLSHSEQEAVSMFSAAQGPAALADQAPVDVEGDVAVVENSDYDSPICSQRSNPNFVSQTTFPRYETQTSSRQPAERSSTQQGCAVGEATPPQVDAFQSMDDVGELNLTPVPIIAEGLVVVSESNENMAGVKELLKERESECLRLEVTIMEKDASLQHLREQMVLKLVSHKAELTALTLAARSTDVVHPMGAVASCVDIVDSVEHGGDVPQHAQVEALEEEIGALLVDLANLQLVNKKLVEKLEQFESAGAKNSVGSVEELNERLKHAHLRIEELTNLNKSLGEEKIELQFRVIENSEAAGRFEAQFVELSDEYSLFKIQQRCKFNECAARVKQKAKELLEAYNISAAKDEEIRNLRTANADLTASMEDICRHGGPKSYGSMAVANENWSTNVGDQTVAGNANHPGIVGTAACGAVSSPSVTVVRWSGSSGSALTEAEREQQYMPKRVPSSESLYGNAVLRQFDGPTTGYGNLPLTSAPKNADALTEPHTRPRAVQVDRVYSEPSQQKIKIVGVGSAESEPLTDEIMEAAEEVRTYQFPGINMKCEAAKKSSNHVLDCLKELWEEHGPMYLLYPAPTVANTSIGQVTAKAAKDILEHGRITDQVIDAIAELIIWLYQRRFPSVLTCKHFPACLWGEIVQKVDSPMRRYWIDNGLEASVAFDEWYFPVNPCTAVPPRELHGDHWVLLKYCVSRNEWKFYNSIPPRNSNCNDQYLVKAMPVVEYVENHLRRFYAVTKPNHPLVKGKSAQPKVQFVQAATQADTSLDCGVIVCNHMFNLMRKQAVKKGEFTEVMSGNFRKKMCDFILDPMNIE